MRSLGSSVTVYGHAGSAMKRLKMPYQTISHRAQVIYSLKQASHLTSRYSAPLLGSNLPLPLSVPETISSVCCEAFGAGFVMHR